MIFKFKYSEMVKKAFYFILLLFIYAPVFSQQIVEKNKYQNPILAGDYADPSILRDGEDYYMVHSSFFFYPGLLIWHSKNLINWEPVTHALHKNLGSVWAPDLVKYKSKYYIYFPANNTNYVVTSNSINGPWSDPLDLKIGNIDPGHVVDNDGKRYLYFSGGCYAPLSDDGLSITGEVKYVYKGWEIPRAWSIECFCMEGPKLTKRGEYYYLTVAEGGTAGPPTSHMVISARSKSPLGPWENSPYNPIIHTKQRTEKWWSKGHGTLVEDISGKWWMVYHAYENGYYNKGRQTLLEPIEWTSDNWYKEPENLKADLPIIKPAGKMLPSNFTLSDNFEGATLNPQWQFYNEYDTSRFKFNNGALIINAKGSSAGDCSPLTCMPTDHSYDVQVEIETEGEAIGGLTLYYNDRIYSGAAADKNNFYGILRTWQFPTEKNQIGNHTFLRLLNREHLVDMFYSADGKTWKKLENSCEVSSFNHNVSGDFLSLRIGLCAIGNGKVRFNNFKYSKVD
jgi:xylan 1,4-beta-xylosidase